MKKNTRRKYLIPAVACLVVVAGIVYYYFFASMAAGNETRYVYIDTDDTVDSVYTKLADVSSTNGMAGFKTLVRHSHYADNIRTGRYAIKPGEGAFTIFRHMKNGLQSPVSLTVPSVRTLDRLAAELSKRLMVDSAAIYEALSDEAICKKYGYDTATVAALFIPNTYDIYWNVSVEKLLDRMKKENHNFWSGQREEKARAMKLTPVEVTTLASTRRQPTTARSLWWQECTITASCYATRNIPTACRCRLTRPSSSHGNVSI